MGWDVGRLKVRQCETAENSFLQDNIFSPIEEHCRIEYSDI